MNRVLVILITALFLGGVFIVPQQQASALLPSQAANLSGAATSATPPACLQKDGQVIVRHLDSRQDYRGMDFRVYLPPCYREDNNRRYPVLYLVHGQSSTDAQWDELGIDETADTMIRSGEIPALIIVMPRDRVWTAPSQDPFDDILLEELIPLIDREYRTLSERRFRAVGGLSRGAGWAVHLGLAHWRLFGSFGAHTPAVFWEDAPQLRTWLSGLAESQRPRIYIDVADRDRDEIRFSALQLGKIMAELAVPHEFYQFVGLHNADYWSNNLERYLLWYTAEWEE